MKRYLLVMLLACAGWSRALASDCDPIPPAVTAHIIAYLGQRVFSGAGGTPAPKVLSTAPVHDSCYQQLVIEVSGTANPITLYLSPDQRFLTSTLYDLASDPSRESANIAAKVQKLLMRDESPTLSGPHPITTVVEFGDLQCLHCKQFATWYRALPSSIAGQTRLVFKHFPLEHHIWARSAALFSACAGRQSEAAFWELSDYLLMHQEEIKAGNVEPIAVAVLSTNKSVDVGRLVHCAVSGPGERRRAQPVIPSRY